MNNNRVPKDSIEERESLKELLVHLAKNFTTVVRGEIALAAHDLRDRITAIQYGLLLVAGAIFIAFAAFLTLCAAVVILLLEFMSATGATLTVGGTLLVISLLLAFFGYKKITVGSQ